MAGASDDQVLFEFLLSARGMARTEVLHRESRHVRGPARRPARSGTEQVGRAVALCVSAVTWVGQMMVLGGCAVAMPPSLIVAESHHLPADLSDAARVMA